MPYRLILIAALIFCARIARSQFADKKYYLVDSLVISDLGEKDRHKLDSLLRHYHAEKVDSIRLKDLNKLTLLEDFETWVKYEKVLLREIKILFPKHRTPGYVKFLNRFYGTALYNMNYYYSMINMEDSSFKYLQLCIEPFTAANDHDGLADAYNAIGVYYNRIGKTEACLKYLQKGLKIQEEIRNKQGIARARISIGLIYRDLGQYDKALEECNKSLKIQEEMKDIRGQSELWNYMGMIYKWSGDTLKAEESYKKSLAFGKESGDLYQYSSALLNLGIIYQDRKEYDKAISNYEQSLENFRKLKSTNGESYALNSLAITCNLTGQSKKALKYAQASHELCLQMEYPESLVNSSQVLYDTYRRLGRYKEAFDMQSFHFMMKDSVENVENQKKILKSQLEFESKEKLLKVEKAQEQKDLKTAEEKKQREIIIVSVVVCLVLVIGFTAFLFNRFRLIQKQKKIIELKEQETQKQNEIITEQKHIVEEKNKEILDSISYAKRLQEAILPSFADVKNHLPESFIYYKPKDIVAGDFYWMETVSSAGGETVLIAAADSTGHGVPGAMVSVVCSNALNRTVLEFGITEPGKILDKTREIVLETFAKSNKDVKDGMDISLVSIQRSTNPPGVQVKWAGANNPLWYASTNSISGAAELKEIKADKQPVGKTDNPQPFKTHVLELGKGDLIYLFTDGFADQFGGPAGKKFKYKPFGDLLLKLYLEDPTRQSEAIDDAFKKWKGELEQVDDVCIIGIRL
ncbi:MAG: protein serine/threonine phosphatase [Bacteroidetes bacterium]|jgi:serine phosphatase RsbU (regulator of sigma subunit)/Tfp pilus assembly protein PilF|nr:protein serine/threonine phosphatase [Bacteroidota bacterium]